MPRCHRSRSSACAVKPKAATPGYRIKNKRIRQSIMGWTYNPMPTEELIATCVDIGLTGIEG
ncbi:MAG: hypothetical protein Ct9H300mP7_6180 [Verrucomicrobiota bacterium]|nr:MAG: hypothetical protein Ct9H300mP7_6180 [Verrucomicrobiota bacterium]